MTLTPHSPLDENHLAQINHGIKQAEIAQARIDMAKRAGIDVGHHEQSLNDSINKLKRIKSVYFPGQ